jgi:hypothetical protein
MAAIFQALKANDSLAAFSRALESTPWASSAYGGSSFAAPSGIYAVGDPVGSSSSVASSMAQMAPLPTANGGLASMSVGGYMAGTGRNITINMPIQVVGVTQQDAQVLAQQVVSLIQKADGMQSVAAN